MKNKLRYSSEWQLPEFEIKEFQPKKNKYCIGLPVINEGQRLKKQLLKMKPYSNIVDILIFDGGSTDGSVDFQFLKKQNVRALLVKKSPGKQGTQLRMGLAYALREGYEGILTVDGNNKDGVEAIPDFIQKLKEGYDLVQGSRYVKGGKELNTPWLRHLGNHFILAPLFSLFSGFNYSDVTNGFRGYSVKLLTDRKVAPFRDVFVSYELLFYLGVRAGQLKYKITELPVFRGYPQKGKIPTKITGVKALINVFTIGVKVVANFYNP
jgi:dolichol-phosphate mannosyltransferase